MLSFPRIFFVACVSTLPSDEVQPPALELDDCVANFADCLSLLMASNTTGAANEEELAFSILGSWMKQLYTKQEGPKLAEDFALRTNTLARLQSLASLSATKPSISIAVGQMLFLYFWWGVQPPPVTGANFFFRGPDMSVISVAAELHELSIHAVGCDAPGTTAEEFSLLKCPWRWRFVLLLLVELGRKLIVQAHDLTGGMIQLRLAEKHLQSMRSLPYFSEHKSLLEGPYRSNHNDDFLPHVRHQPVWPRSMWPSFANYLEAHAEVFLGELLRLIEVDKDFDEVFRLVQEQQTEFTPLPREWGLLDLVRQGKPTAACPYAPLSCELLQNRPEINEKCHSEDRMPNAGVAFARLLPGTEIKPHFATEPRIAVHLGLVTPPGATMMVANESVTWSPGRAIVFDDTYIHSVRHDGVEPRYVLLAWTCHPCDHHWQANLGEDWLRHNPLPDGCKSASS